MKKGVLLLAVTIILVAGLSFVFATHAITIPASFVTNQSQNFFFNITLNNTDIDPAGNITQINITLPPGFAYFANTNGSSVLRVFVNTSTRALSWSNDSVGGVLNCSTNTANINGTFWFNATTNSTPGTYNITVMSLNVTGGAYYTNISVTVNDITKPVINFTYPTSSGGYQNWNSLWANVTSDDLNNDTIIIYLFNTTGIVNQSNSTAGLHSWFVNFTNLRDGTYYLNATANDSAGNSNLTETRTIEIDTVSPKIYLLSPDDGDTWTSDDRITFEYNVTDVGGVANCSLYIDNDINKTDTSITVNIVQDITSTSMEDNPYDWYILCTDNAGNINQSEEWSVTLDYVAEEDSGDGGGGDYTPSFWTNTYSPTEDLLLAGYNKQMAKGERVRIKIGKDSHYVGITKLTSSEATINVSSTPQIAVLTVGETKKFEVTNDSYYDVSVELNSINGSKANMTITYIYEKMPGASTTSTTGGNNQTATPNQTEEQNLLGSVGAEAKSLAKNKWFWIILTVALLAIGGALFYFFVLKQKKIRSSVKVKEQ